MQWCCWEWSYKDCLYVYEDFKCSTIIVQCEKYLDGNKTRNSSKSLRFRTNGSMKVEICARYPYVLKRAAFMAQKYEKNNPKTTHTATLILTVIWEVFSEMRFVFWVLWTPNFVKNHKNDRPDIIQEMMNRGWRAIYLAYHLCDVLVCSDTCKITNITLMLLAKYNIDTQ